MKKFFVLLPFLLANTGVFAQSKKTPVLASGKAEAILTDGAHVHLNWHLDPKANPDIYYVNIPRRNSKVTFRTDKGALSFETHFGNSYDFLIVVNSKDTCHISILAKDNPGVQHSESNHQYPDTIPFILKGSRVYLAGKLNGEHLVTVQLDLG